MLDELSALILTGGDERLRDRFIGMTPVLPDARHEYRGRERECLRWLESDKTGETHWLAIDV